MEEKQNIFREKSLERLASPEKLNDYMRVTTPSVWVALAAVLALLLGFLAWGALGNIEITVAAGASVSGGSAKVYFPAQEAQRVRAGMPLRVGDAAEAQVTSISRLPVLADEDMGAALLNYARVEAGDPVYVIELRTPLPDGTYPAEIVTERITPISFLTLDSAKG